jgi:hypothetical protein
MVLDNSNIDRNDFFGNVRELFASGERVEMARRWRATRCIRFISAL